MNDCIATASCRLKSMTLPSAGKVQAKNPSILKRPGNMNADTGQPHIGTSRTSFRYRVGLPPVAVDYQHEFSLFCPPDLLPWQKYRWGRFGSGGAADAWHCFVDDWRLEHLWRRPGQGMVKAIFSQVITAPDFSVETDFPFELVSYQVWRSRVLSLYWQENGVVVVPVLQWGSPESFPLCARGIRPGSVVAVRGPQRGTECAWLDGAHYMLKTVRPALVLHFGNKLEIWDRAFYFPLRSTR